MASKAERLAALKKLKQAREGGGRDWKQDDDVDIYYEVAESDYKKIVKQRLDKDDFIEDDGVGGYADNGMDDFGDADHDYESEEELRLKTKKKSKSTKQKPKVPPPVAPTINDYRPKPSAATEEDFMASLIGNMNSIAPEALSRSLKRKPRRDTPSPPSSPKANAYRTNGSSYANTSSDGPNDFNAPFEFEDDFNVASPVKRPKILDSGITPAVKKMAEIKMQSSDGFELPIDDSFDDIDMDDYSPEDDEDVKLPKTVKVELDEIGLPKSSIVSKASIKKEETETQPSWLNIHSGLTVATEDTLGPLASSTSVTASNIRALEEDGSLRFFWIDFSEVEGQLHIIGKLKDKASGAWVSCCVTVENIQRNLFVLPRERQLDDDFETDVVPSQADVYRDFDAVRKHAGIKTFKGKFVKRKYAFGEADVPTAATEWLKIVYPFTEPAIPNNVSSPNFSRIFGTNTTAFELFVLKRKIMGPCWLEIKNPNLEQKGISWCKFEVTVSDPKEINPFAETDSAAPKDIPPLTVMSLSVRTIMNHRENKREIVCASARIWANIQIDDPTPPDQLPCTVHTFVRPLEKFPPNFATLAQANKKGLISPELNERALLNKLLMAIFKSDPDVIVGHDFLGVTLDVLLTRMKDLKADNWSRISRFRRKKMPNIGRQGTNLKFLYGRLLCDLSSDGAKSMISSTTWSLTEMCSTHLKSAREDIDPDETATYFDPGVTSPSTLMKFVRHCELDAHYQMAITAKVQILGLTKQLTNLAGNAWNQTLNGGRATRNEYILLHEFHRLKYICPDKTWGKKSAVALKQELDEDGVAVKGKKKDKYKGGLVFEPKRGLWDKYILVMDFNSLYPSIIQEYNIDFTTIDRADGEDDVIPEPPQPEVPQGVLPRLIATLVNRRRQVKSLMKDRSAPPAKLLQWDIKQQALKLTANSMYGCLGFEYSRFYARPLAALTTFKGREILTQTRELAESLSLDVVYGDTDSVFVNTNVTDFAEALKISAEFKKQVNERYRLLEIDLDGVFQRLLLLQKKKYAALKVEDATRTSVEVKGLDMKRREYCALSKRVSQYVLDQILSGEATETVIEKIHDYLSTLGEMVRTGKIGLEEFIIFKRLGKNPEDYPDAKSQPHVTVALRMKTRGGTTRGGDVIPYVFCLGEGEQTSKTAQADRARHPDEIRKAAGDLKIDYEHYLSQQILPPIERLCEPIEGTDRSRLAECLGLDPGRYRSSVTATEEDRGLVALESQMPPSIRFKDVDPLVIRCRKCKGEMPFNPIIEQSSILLPTGPTCAGCQAPLSTVSMQMQLEAQIRDHINRYYEGWTVCEDAVCGNRTRMMGVYGRRCLRPSCRATVSFEYSDVQLYNQLMYYRYLFHKDKALEAAGSRRSDIEALKDQNTAFLDSMSLVVERFLNQCGRRWVELGNLFSFMKL